MAVQFLHAFPQAKEHILFDSNTVLVLILLVIWASWVCSGSWVDVLITVSIRNYSFWCYRFLRLLTHFLIKLYSRNHEIRCLSLLRWLLLSGWWKPASHDTTAHFAVVHIAVSKEQSSRHSTSQCWTSIDVTCMPCLNAQRQSFVRDFIAMSAIRHSGKHLLTYPGTGDAFF